MLLPPTLSPQLCCPTLTILTALCSALLGDPTEVLRGAGPWDPSCQRAPWDTEVIGQLMLTGRELQVLCFFFPLSTENFTYRPYKFIIITSWYLPQLSHQNRSSSSPRWRRSGFTLHLVHSNGKEGQPTELSYYLFIYTNNNSIT